MIQVSRYAGLSDEQLTALHAQCEQFELSLRRGETVSLEVFLSAASPEIHDLLFQELLAIELEWRLPQDSWPHLIAYQNRFPNRHRQIEHVVSEVSKAWLSKAEGNSTASAATATQFGSRYRLDGEIARGGMGVVFKGSDTKLQRELAIKVLADEHKDNPEVIQRFVKEAQIGGQLQHPGIAPVYELGTFTDARPFFSMKLVKGQTLSALLASRETTTEERAKFLGIFLKVCQTVAYAHEQGIIHRDLKPLNIMVGAFGEVQVMDWGLAKLLAGHGLAGLPAGDWSSDAESTPPVVTTQLAVLDSTHTQLGCVMGTPAYMSPEQARGQVSQLDERADVFGLGAMLSEILTGLPPYSGRNHTQTLQLALAGNLDDCFERLAASEEDPDLLKIAKGCLSADPHLRTRHAGVLAQQLADYLESVDLKLRATELDRAAQQARLEQQQRSAARLWSLVIGLTLVATVAVTAAVIAGQSWQLANRAKLSAESSERSLAKSEAAERRVAAAANALRMEAEKNLAKATAAENDAVEQRERADAAADTTQQNLYYAEMHLAQQAWREHRGLLNMRVLLDNWLPKHGSVDRRGWEWYYLNSLAEQNVTTLSQPGQAYRPAAVAWHELTNRLAEGGPDGVITIRDGVNKNVLSRLQGPQPEVPYWGRTWFAWSRDGRQLVAGGKDGTLRVWETPSGKLLQQIHAFDSPVGAVTFDRAARQVSAWGLQGAIKTWDLQTRSELAEFPVPDATTVVAWSPDDQSFAAGLADGRITIAKMTTGETVASWQAHIDLLYHLAWSPDSRRLASTSSNDFFVNIWDVASHRKVLGPMRHSHGITSMAWASDGGQLATGSMDEIIKIWNTSSGLEHATLRGHGNAVVSLAWGGDDSLASYDDWGGLKIWNNIHNQESGILPGVMRVSALAWQPDGRQLAAGSDDGKLRLWDVRTRQKIDELKAHREQQSLVLPSGEIGSIAWSPDGKLLASAGMDGTLLINEPGTGRELYRWPAEHGPLWSVAWNTTSSRLAVGADDGTLIVLSNLTETPEITTHATKHTCIRGVAWSHARDQLAVAGNDGLITLCDANDGSEVQRLQKHTGTVTDVAWSPNGQRLASTGTDNLVMIWDVSVGKLVASMRGHTTWIERVVWSPDGRRIATAGMDSTVRVWDPQTGKEAFALHGNPYGRFHDVAWHPDGAQIAAAASDGQVWIWDASGWPSGERREASSE